MDELHDIFRFESNDIKPEKGRILIAEPFLEGRYFKRSVVLLTEFSNNGALGFVLNKPIHLNINELLTDLDVFESEVFVGGPVQNNQIYYLHTVPHLIPNSFQVLDNLYWGGDFAILKELIVSKRLKVHQIRFFAGYSGWSAGQLEEEIKENSWLVSSLKAEEIMSENSDIWQDALNQLGGNYKLWANFPKDQNMN
ncbi:YqgE/AlgH family protein [Ancylomarina euxinus]|uniref:YqgE/AlgH family protein n=1 Tax=Ancylomarina euxinus TaxID=2283627 RepID=UPI0012E12B82|nr:YqgE/AlgH family protein [Ancylomarina euxinus]MCZ4694133.1 YqgE/AlgH family protein [Ancylomarina euxinus]